MFFRSKSRKEADSEDRAAPAEPGQPSSNDPQGALRDELGLYHLWYMELRMREELVRAARINSVFSLAAWRLRLLPGEEPQPELLRQVAEFLVSRLRSYDIAARIDSQRFVAILFDADYPSATTVAFRLKADIQTQIPSVGRWQGGVATFGRDGVNGDALIQAALRRLEEDAQGTAAVGGGLRRAG
jgi:hypothetical protein